MPQRATFSYGGERDLSPSLVFTCNTLTRLVRVCGAARDREQQQQHRTPRAVERAKFLRRCEKIYRSRVPMYVRKMRTRRGARRRRRLIIVVVVIVHPTSSSLHSGARTQHTVLCVACETRERIYSRQRSLRARVNSTLYILRYTRKYFGERPEKRTRARHTRRRRNVRPPGETPDSNESTCPRFAAKGNRLALAYPSAARVNAHTHHGYARSGISRAGAR